MKKLWLSLLCGALALWMLLLSSCQFIPSIEETESETESETEAETVPVFEAILKGSDDSAFAVPSLTVSTRQSFNKKAVSFEIT